MRATLTVLALAKASLLLDGRFLYAWGVWGDFPGGMWGAHGFSVDQEGNVYIAEVDNGRVQKYRPRPGANPDFRVGTPVRSAVAGNWEFGIIWN
jgi:hypothetical protein